MLYKFLVQNCMQCNESSRYTIRTEQAVKKLRYSYKAVTI